MCLTITLHDLGPADALLDLEEGLLVLRPSCTPDERLELARCLLTRNGIPQTCRNVAVCSCGEVLMTGPDASRVVSLAAAGVAAFLAWLLVAVLPLIFAEPAVVEPTPPPARSRAAHTAVVLE